MLILCDRCKTRFTYVDKVFKDDWVSLKKKDQYDLDYTSLYLCKDCREQFKKFMWNRIYFEREDE